MMIKTVLIGFLLVLENVKSQNCKCSTCPCRLDSRSGSMDSLIIRPKLLSKPGNTVPLHRGGLGYFRKRVIIKPALIPEPVYLQTDAESANAELASAVATAAQILVQSKGNGHFPASAISPNNNNKANNCISKAYERIYSKAIPADPVSLALAYKRAQNNYNKVIEDGLSYGFRKLPIDVNTCTKNEVHQNGPSEEHLYSLNGQIVELLKESGSESSLSQEAIEDLLNDEISDEIRSEDIRRPSLEELGYGPAKVSAATFENIPSAVAAPAVDNEELQQATIKYKEAEPENEEIRIDPSQEEEKEVTFITSR